MLKKHKIKIAGICIIILFLILIFFFIPHSVKSFGPLKLGDSTPLRVGDGAMHPYRYIWESEFYVYVVQKDAYHCALEDCGMSGVLVDCMGGWISGDTAIASAHNGYGLNKDEVEAGKSSIVVVADKDQKIIGIYPNYTIQNIPYILKNHRDIIDRDAFDFCYNTQMPKRW